MLGYEFNIYKRTTGEFFVSFRDEIIMLLQGFIEVMKKKKGYKRKNTNNED